MKRTLSLLAGLLFLSLLLSACAGPASQPAAARTVGKTVQTAKGQYMSTAAAHTLADLGYTHVYNLVGGFTAWQMAGLPLDMNQ